MQQLNSRLQQRVNRPAVASCRATPQHVLQPASHEPHTPGSAPHLLTRTLLSGCLAAMVLAHPASAAQLVDLVEPLKAFDSNADGVMDVAELQAAFQQAVGVDVPDIAIQLQVVPSLDFNDDGVVSTRDEFLRGMALQLPVDNNFWKIADTDGDGTLTVRELKAALGDVGGQAGDVVIGMAFKQADRVPRDGRLTPGEVEDAMRTIARGVLTTTR